VIWTAGKTRTLVVAPTRVRHVPPIYGERDQVRRTVSRLGDAGYAFGRFGGYDHKKMGNHGARRLGGEFNSRHFAEMGQGIQTENPSRLIGVGDNERRCLRQWHVAVTRNPPVAAFNHSTFSRPEIPADSKRPAERQRLQTLQGRSWRTMIRSYLEGCGVFGTLRQSITAERRGQGRDRPGEGMRVDARGIDPRPAQGR